MIRIPVIILLVGYLVLPGAILSTAGNRPDSSPLEDDSLIPRPPERSLTIPKGTKLHIRLKDKLTSNGSEGTFEGVLDRPVNSHGRVVLPPGVRVSGRVALEESTEINGKRPAMTMRLNQLRVDRKTIRIETEVLALGVPIRDDGARLKALDSDDSPGRPLSYPRGAMFTFKLAEPVQVPDGRR
jgi:hypothetical protein